VIKRKSKLATLLAGTVIVIVLAGLVLLVWAIIMA